MPRDVFGDDMVCPHDIDVDVYCDACDAEAKARQIDDAYEKYKDDANDKD